MSLKDVKILTGVDNDKIVTIHSQIEGRLLRRLNRALPDLKEVPLELEYIVTECTIARYNRIGSEGMSQESMDGHTATYQSVELSDYEEDILDYIHSKTEEPILTNTTGKVRFF